MAESWPDHSHELARKSLETLKRFTYLADHGRMKPAHLALVLTVLVDVTQGLVPDDVFEILNRARKELMCR